MISSFLIRKLVVTGVATGYAVISASITESSKTYTDICTVTVIPAS